MLKNAIQKTNKEQNKNIITKESCKTKCELLLNNKEIENLDTFKYESNDILLKNIDKNN